MLYDKKRDAESPGGRWQNLYERWSNIHPTTQGQWNEQKFIEGLPYVGGWYSDWMRGRSVNEYNSYMRERLGITDISPEFPWLSDYGSSNPDVRFVGNLGNSATSAIMRLYSNDRKEQKRKKRRSRRR